MPVRRRNLQRFISECFRTNQSKIDISFHAIPSIVMLVDLLLLSPPWTISVLPSLGLSGAIAFGYWFWVERCFSYNGW